MIDSSAAFLDESHYLGLGVNRVGTKLQQQLECVGVPLRESPVQSKVGISVVRHEDVDNSQTVVPKPLLRRYRIKRWQDVFQDRIGLRTVGEEHPAHFHVSLVRRHG
ncbi:hypothetical protein ACRE_022050 [Hapsidospora chrysogenum ATCC 11550]|uniref:Uncharacterized protein n=1 Tax=Hapsidospora chrysogenum (strain ATCC 11550 / CBS 779.69 / DSM 880 / IAM 14645 / JCM 23072 / IMI 49137) TaxID=857340 RepID=A0A086TBZ6_HAPC1|nr:hypothetical protein ACRE_022050 [Hapsidospora chrysogenum ATCC 11550]